MHTMKTLAPTYNRYTTRSTIFRLLVALLLTMSTLTLSATTLEEAMGHRLEIKQTTTPQESKADVTKQQKKRSPQTINKASEQVRVLKETIEEVTGNRVNYAFATKIIAACAGFDLDEARKHYHEMEKERKEMKQTHSDVNKACQQANKNYVKLNMAYECSRLYGYRYVPEMNDVESIVEEWNIKLLDNKITCNADKKVLAIKQAIKMLIGTDVTSTFAGIIAGYAGIDVLKEMSIKACYEREEMQRKQKEAWEKHKQVRRKANRAFSNFEDIFCKYEKDKPAFKQWKILATYIKAKAGYLKAQERYEEVDNRYLELDEEPLDFVPKLGDYMKKKKAYGEARKKLQGKYTEYAVDHSFHDVHQKDLRTLAFLL